jgi:hypothetical protein
MLKRGKSFSQMELISMYSIAAPLTAQAPFESVKGIKESLEEKKTPQKNIDVESTRHRDTKGYIDYHQGWWFNGPKNFSSGQHMY